MHWKAHSATRSFFLFISLLLLQPTLNAITWPITYIRLSDSPATSMHISWITEAYDTNNIISYRSNMKKDRWKTAEGYHLPFPSGLHFVHHVTLNKLKPSCRYQFRLPNSQTTLSFKTVSSSLPLRFVVGGDANQQGSALFRKTCIIAKTVHPAFTLLGGDLAYSHRGKSSHEISERWLQWLDTYSTTMRNNDTLIPLAVAIGNHDVQGFFNKTSREAPAFYALFPTGAFHAIRIDNLLSIYILDSGHTTPIPGHQAVWLASELARDNQCKNRFAIYHMPAFPLLAKNVSEQTKLLQQYWVPLFEQYHLHWAFENHEHVYKRSHPLKAGNVSTEGVKYVGGGGWGVNPRNDPKNYHLFAAEQSTCHFVQVDLGYTTRRLTAIAANGEVIDCFEENY